MLLLLRRLVTVRVLSSGSSEQNQFVCISQRPSLQCVTLPPSLTAAAITVPLLLDIFLTRKPEARSSIQTNKLYMRSTVLFSGM
jgi:hypothetical protein